MNRTQCAGRSCWQYCRRWRGGITPGEKFKCKGDEQTEIRLQVLYCGRGYYGGLPAIRAHKIAQAAPMRARFQKVYDYQQLLSINKECLKMTTTNNMNTTPAAAIENTAAIAEKAAPAVWPGTL